MIKASDKKDSFTQAIKNPLSRLIPNPKLTFKFAAYAPFIFKNFFEYYLDLLRLKKGRLIVYKLRNGLSYMCKSGTFSKDIISEIFIDKVYNPNHLDIEIKDRDNVLDIGGHIGIFSVLASKKAVYGKVFTIEPNKESFNFLKKNIEINKCVNIRPFNFGLSDETKDAVLYKRPSTPGSGSVFWIWGAKLLNTNELDEEKIKLMSINDFLSKEQIPQINFMKIDCEGSEYNILYSMEKRYLHKIRNVVIEYHNIMGNNKFTAQALMNYLRKEGFSITHKPDYKNIMYGYLYCKNKLVA